MLDLLKLRIASFQDFIFLSGRAIFTPEKGEAVTLGAGDVAHFPENSRGVWEIVETSRKIFMILDEERDL